MASDFTSTLFKYGVFFPVVALRGERVFHYLGQLERSQWSDQGELERLQDEKLQHLLEYSRTNVPLYRERMQHGSPAGLQPREVLARLPFTTKHDLVHANLALRSTAHSGPVTIKTTGGSTGRAVTVRKSRHATALEQAANWRGFRWAGIDIGDRQARFWGMPATAKGRLRARLIDWLGHRRRYSAFQFSTDDLAVYLSDVQRFRPHYLYGYVSMLRSLAQYLIDRNRLFPADLQAVVSTSEPLTDPDRRLFQQAFGARVYNEYGCGELGTIAHECDRGGLHVHTENLLVEVLNADGSPSHDRPGEVVVTELNNLAMPLIRYRLADFAALSTDRCPCGRTLPTLSNVFGRSYDMIGNRQGQKFHGEFFMYIFEAARVRNLGVDAFQVIQHDYERLTVKVVTSAEYGPASEVFIRERIQAGLGARTEIMFELVNSIPRERSGKLRLVIGATQAT